MANKVKRISINALEKIVDEQYKPEPIAYEWNGISVTIHPVLSFEEMLTFVDGVVKSCFTSTDGKYMPEIKDFAIRCSILEIYANFSLPSNVEKRYALTNACDDLIDTIVQNINLRQYSSMLDAIDKKIEYIAEANIDALTARMNELYNSFETVEKQLGGLLGGVNQEDVKKMIDAVSDSKLDETKIVRAIYDEKAKGAEG